MKTLLRSWIESFKDWIEEEEGEGFTFSTIFALIFVECAYLFAYTEISTAIKMSIILLGYIVTNISFTCIRRILDDRIDETILDKIELIVIAILFIAGCIINLFMNLILMAILVLGTAVFLTLKTMQITACFFVGKGPSFLKALLYSDIGQYIIVFVTNVLPFILFVVFIFVSPNLIIQYKIVISIIYFLIYFVGSPFAIMAEDYFSGSITDIFSYISYYIENIF